jgi:Zn-dependent alcohol dehydrogenase
MKFTVREGFVVAYTDRIKSGDKVIEREYAFYPEDGAFDLDAEHAAAHAHKLEAADKAAQALLERLYVATPEPVAAPDMQAMIAAAVQAGIAAFQAASQKPAS